jgi:hypothetical protein
VSPRADSAAGAKPPGPPPARRILKYCPCFSPRKIAVNIPSRSPFVAQKSCPNNNLRRPATIRPTRHQIRSYLSRLWSKIAPYSVALEKTLKKFGYSLADWRQ